MEMYLNLLIRGANYAEEKLKLMFTQKPDMSVYSRSVNNPNLETTQCHPGGEQVHCAT